MTKIFKRTLETERLKRIYKVKKHQSILHRGSHQLRSDYKKSKRIYLDYCEKNAPLLMHIEHNVRVPGVDLLHFPAHFAHSVPSKFKLKDTRGTCWFVVGWTTNFSASVCGVPCAFKTKALQYLEQHPRTLEAFRKCVVLLSTTVNNLFPIKAAIIRSSISNYFRLFNTVFTTCVISTNFVGSGGVEWHYDPKNLEAVGAVLVFGYFQGGEVEIDTNGRYGKSRSPNTFSKGDEPVRVIVNSAGTIFCGLYGAVWHKVRKVTCGYRSIISAFSKSSVAQCSAAIQSHNMSCQEATRRGREKVIDRRKRDDENNNVNVE